MIKSKSLACPKMSVYAHAATKFTFASFINIKDGNLTICLIVHYSKGHKANCTKCN